VAVKVRQLNPGAGAQLIVQADNLIGPLVETLADHVEERMRLVLDELRRAIEVGGGEIDDVGGRDDAHLDREQLIIEIPEHRDGKSADLFNFERLKADVRISLGAV